MSGPRAVVRVRGESTAEHPPDVAVLSVSASATSPDSRERALTEASEVTARLRAALEGADGVRRVVLSRVSVHERSAWDPAAGRHEPAGWEATVGGSVRADAGAAENLAEVVAAAGAGIGGVAWELDDPAAARRAVRRAAVEAAREAAADLADAAGRDLGPLLELADAGLSSAAAPESMAVMARGSPDGGPGLTLDPRDVTVSAVVEATYALDD
ncbi:SIMPL domain-containing protein [Geodermatophilus sp. SYSU D00766]